jgi:two-component system cell cycle sensor histidine kinase/response regulator CckA
MRAAPTIIMVDDTEALRRIMARALVRAGYWVLEAESGGEALALLDHEGRVDLLITDIDLPEINGVRLAIEFRARRPAVQVLYTSGATSNGAPGAFLPKPFTLQQLLDHVKDLVGPGLLGATWSSPGSAEAANGKRQGR